MVQGAQKGVPWDSGASAVYFGENFKKQKLLGTLNLVGVGHLFRPQIWIWKNLGPVSFWSRGHSLSRRVYKIKVVVNVPNSAWPQGPGRPMSGYLNILYSSN